MSNYQLFQNDLPTQVLKSFKGDISIDTETLGLNIKRDRLCLVQLRNESNKKIYLIKFDSKPLAKNSKNLIWKNNINFLADGVHNSISRLIDSLELQKPPHRVFLLVHTQCWRAESQIKSNKLFGRFNRNIPFVRFIRQFINCR